MVGAKSGDFSDWCWTFARSVRFAIHLSMTSRTAGRLSATSTLVSQSETSDPNQPSFTIRKPLHFTFARLCSSIVQDLPTIPNPTPYMMKEELPSSGRLWLKTQTWSSPHNPASLIYHCLRILYLPCPPSFVSLLQSKCPFSPKSATDSESVTQFVVSRPPRSLWEQSVLARRPDVEHCCCSAGTCVPHSEEAPLLFYALNHHWIIKS